MRRTYIELCGKWVNDTAPNQMTPASASSATPILDLLAAMPRPKAEDFTLRRYSPLILIVGTALVFRNYQLLAVVVGFLFIALAATTIHEFGHISAGYLLGFYFQYVGIGPIWVRHESDRWTVKPRGRLISGLTSMSLDRICRVRRRLMIFGAAGPAAGLLVGVIALACLRVAINRDDPSLSLLLACFGVYSVYINVVSVVPIRYGRYASDGMRLRVLLCSKEGARQVLATHALGMQRRRNIDPFCLNSRWVQIASSAGNVIVDTRYTTYVADWNAYQNAVSTELAARFLERCLASSAFLSAEDRDVLIVEASIFTARQRNDARKADIWFKRVANPKQVHPLIRLRAEAALSPACGRFDDALRYLERGLEIIRQLPAFGIGRRQEAAWLDWRREIETRRGSQTIAVGDTAMSK